MFLYVGLNYIFIFGLGPIPELGIVGLAISSFIIRSLLALTLILYILKRVKRIDFSINWSFIKHVFKFSIPIAFTIFAEVGAFCFASIVIGTLGIEQSAANNIILTLTGITFMIPLAISSATAVKIGYALGEKNLTEINSLIKSSLILSSIFMLCSALLFATFPYEFLLFFTPDINVIAIGLPIMYLIALYQICDGLQVTLTGILRGLGETKMVSYTILIIYWFVSIPIGMYLAFNLDFKAKGIWISLTGGLFFIAFTLLLLLKHIYAKTKNNLVATRDNYEN